MRNEVVEFLLTKHREGKEPFVFITGDLGFSVLEPLRKALGPNFINAGVAEALMTSIAAAISSYDLKTFTYSIMPFATLRCLEQIRNDVCYHQQDVTIIGVGSGYGYGSLGPTHHSIEDLAAIWALPGIRIYHPADLNEANACFEDSWQFKGPKYMRLSKGGDGYLSQLKISNFTKEQVVEYQPGNDLTVISTGTILGPVMEAIQTLEAQEKEKVQILSCPILKPFPSEELIHKVTSKKVIIVEELSRYGGFSSQCAKAFLSFSKTNSKSPPKCFDSISPADGFSKIVGSPSFQRTSNGLGKDVILDRISKMLKLKL